MQWGSAYNFTYVTLATLLAVAFLAAWVVVGHAITAVARLRASREFAAFPCPVCGLLLGPVAVRAGRDVSPFEQWCEVAGKVSCCHPTCREVRSSAARRGSPR